MSEKSSPEVWLQGPIEGIPPLLQPVAHALLQAVNEVSLLMRGFPDEWLWKRPAGLASPAFHLQHLSGVLDRLFTYASGAALSAGQMDALKAEGVQAENIKASVLVEQFNLQVQKSIDQLKTVREDQLTASRKVGRAGLPSTTIGLYVHAAEHSMRHVGQLLVTVTFVKHYKDIL